MPLAAGQTLTHYEILGPLGAGGMGEVYRARDTRLEREVAIKVLPEELADDEERLRRFEREAKTLASLNHTNVAGIHGVDQEGDVCFLALELVPGEDLAALLSRGPLPVDEAIAVCRQIAEGLEVAHEAGVVHRDLKPANVRITPDGVVKLLDFGLAKPIRPKSGTEGTSTSESDSILMTEEGLVLGTPTYMSPEQARGKPVDRRTDIWAFGCVLYECLCGERVFRGESFTDVLAAIVGDKADWSRLPALPPRVSELLRRCLTKDPRERLRDIGEARMQLQLAKGELSAGPLQGVAEVASPGAPGRGRWLLPAAVGLALVLGYPLGSFVLGTFGDDRTTAATDGTPTSAPPRMALDVQLAEFREAEGVHEVRLSPDGTHVAWAGRRLQSDGFFVRAIGDRQARRLEGVEGDSVRMFAWSPDSTQLAYVGDEGLFTIGIDGGGKRQLSDQKHFRGGLLWLPEGLVLAEGSRVLRIPPDGGEAETLFTFEEEEVVRLAALVAVPGDRGFLCVPQRGVADSNTIEWRSGEDVRTLLTMDASSMHDFFLVGDQLYFMTDGNEGGAWRAPLSLDPVDLGRPVRLPFDGKELSVADDGSMAYLEQDGESEATLGWLDLAGAVLPFGRSHEEIHGCQLSGDGLNVVYTVESSDDIEVWIHELERGFATKRIQPAEGWAIPSFLPDGRLAVATLQIHSGKGETRVYQLSGGSEGERILDRAVVPVAPKTARYRFSMDIDLAGGEVRTVYEDLQASPIEKIPMLSAELREWPLALTREGEWMLYSTNRTGERQLHLGAFPPDSSRDWVVTADGSEEGYFDEERGRILFWRVDDDELSSTLWSVSYQLSPTVKLGRPEKILDVPKGVELKQFDEANERFLVTVIDENLQWVLRLISGGDPAGAAAK